MSEIIPIVNEKDEVISGENRETFDKSTGKIYRTVSVVIINLRGEILIQRRAMNKTYPGLWDTAGAAGHVHYGETYAEAAEREVEEEVGLIVDKFIPMKKFFYESEKGHRRFMQTFLAVLDFDEADVEILPEEVMEIKLVKFEELKQIIEENPESFRDLSAQVLEQAVKKYDKIGRNL
jgi:mutator protein MutT